MSTQTQHNSITLCISVCWSVYIKYATNTTSSVNECWIVSIKYATDATSIVNVCWFVYIKYATDVTIDLNLFSEPRGTLTVPCLPNDWCLDDHSECKQGVCVCQQGYFLKDNTYCSKYTIRLK